MTQTERTIQRLQKQFPQIWMKPGLEFAAAYDNTIWTGEGSQIRDQPAFCSWGYSRTGGVHPDLVRALDRLDLYADFYDAGTVFIRPR